MTEEELKQFLDEEIEKAETSHQRTLRNHEEFMQSVKEYEMIYGK